MTETQAKQQATCEHEVNPSSIDLRNDGGAFYLDVLCAKCGKSGCIAEIELNEPNGTIELVTNDGYVHSISMIAPFAD